ncbi:MAG: coat protein [Caudoviricetes sp.]|nr:MAG: coat protein [Caudoviricetes sp.]
MANTLTSLIPALYQGLDIVSRELVGLVPAVTMNSGAARAAVGEDVIVPITGTANVIDISPAMAIPEPTDQVVSNTKIQITKARAAEFGFVGEEQRGVNNGAGWEVIQAGMFAQALRKLVNEVEADLAATYLATSRAYGTAGTTPFASDLSDTANLHKILADNGSPLMEKQLVIDTTAGAKMRNLTQLTKANEAGGDTMLRQGVLLDVHGFAIRESAQMQLHTKGTGASFVSNGTFAEGATVIGIDGGTGTVLAGDVITFAGDTNKYVVASALSGGSVTIAAPGLQASLADGVAMTVGGTYTANMAFDKNAIQLVTRAPALPNGTDQAADSMMLTDPRSGLTFEVRVYYGYRKVRYEVALAWGVKNIKPEHSVLLLG